MKGREQQRAQGRRGSVFVACTASTDRIHRIETLSNSLHFTSDTTASLERFGDCHFKSSNHKISSLYEYAQKKLSEWHYHFEKKHDNTDENIYTYLFYLT